MTIIQTRLSCKFVLFLSFFIMLTGALSSTAQAANDDKRMQALEKQLTQATRAIEGLQRQINLQNTKAPVAGAVSGAPVSAVMSEMEERLVAVEDSVFEIDEKVGSRAVAHAFDAMALDIGGFADMAITHVVGEEDSDTNFNRQVFEILIKAKLAPNWDMFIAQAFLRKSGIAFGDSDQTTMVNDRGNPDFADLGSPIATDTVIAWANYKRSDAFNFKMGRFLTPHGIVNMEHFPAALLDPEQPQFLRPFAAQTIFANFTDGVQLHGKFFLGADGQNTLSYDVYTGNFASNSTDFNYGARLAHDWGDLGVTLGLNITAGDRDDDIKDSGYVVYGADFLYDKGKFLWKNEVFVTDEDFGKDRLAFYTQPAYRIKDNLMAFYRYDYLEAGSDGAGVALGDSTENVGGLVWNPVPNVRWRGIYTHKALDSISSTGQPDADADIFQFSATYNF